MTHNHQGSSRSQLSHLQSPILPASGQSDSITAELRVRATCVSEWLGLQGDRPSLQHITHSAFVPVVCNHSMVGASSITADMMHQQRLRRLQVQSTAGADNNQSVCIRYWLWQSWHAYCDAPETWQLTAKCDVAYNYKVNCCNVLMPLLVAWCCCT